jgi:hypothetical protein
MSGVVSAKVRVDSFGLPKGTDMDLLDHPVALFFVVCIALLLTQEIGFRLRALTKHDDGEDGRKQVEETRNQVAILLSLLIGFAISMALGRFDERRKLVIDEANAIGTAYLRASMQVEPVKSHAPELLREYVDTRLTIFGGQASLEERDAARKRATQIQNELWSGATAASQQSPTPITATYVSALNDVFDLDSTRVAGRLNRIPWDVWMLLGALSILTSLIIGYGQKRRAFLASIVPMLTVAIAVSLIADLDSPVSGLIQVSQQSMQSLSDQLHGQTGAH